MKRDHENLIDREDEEFEREVLGKKFRDSRYTSELNGSSELPEYYLRSPGSGYCSETEIDTDEDEAHDQTLRLDSFGREGGIYPQAWRAHSQATLTGSFSDRAIHDGSQEIRMAIQEGNPHIQLSGKALTKLTPEVKDLQAIVDVRQHHGSFEPKIELMLMKNQLTSLPLELFEVTNLRVLSLSFNHLLYIPPAIGSLIKLETLGLANNPLRYLPCELLTLPTLVHLVTSGSINWKYSPPDEILNRVNERTNTAKAQPRPHSACSAVSPEEESFVFYARIRMHHGRFMNHTGQSLFAICLTKISGDREVQHVASEKLDGQYELFKHHIDRAVHSLKMGLTCGICHRPVVKGLYYAHVFEWWTNRFDNSIPWRRNICSAMCFHRWKDGLSVNTKIAEDMS